MILLNLLNIENKDIVITKILIYDRTRLIWSNRKKKQYFLHRNPKKKFIDTDQKINRKYEYLSTKKEHIHYDMFAFLLIFFRVSFSEHPSKVPPK